MAHAILSRGKKSRPERRALLGRIPHSQRVLAFDIRPSTLDIYLVSSPASLALLRLLRLLRENHSAFTPSASPRWVGRVGNQNCTGSGGGAVPEALKMRFSPIWTGLSHGSQRRFPTVPNGSRAGSVRSQVRGPSTINSQPSTNLKSQRSAEHCSAASLTLHASSPARDWRGHQPDAVHCSNCDSCSLFQ